MPPPESVLTRTLRRRWRGSCASDSPGRLDVVGGGVRPCVPGAQDDGQRLPVPVCPVVGPGGHRVEPNVFFPVGAACSFSEWAMTMVASRSTMTRLPSPDRLQPTREVRRQRGDQPGHDRVGRDRARQGRLLPQHRDIGQAVPAQRHRRGQVRDDLARIVDRLRRPPPAQAPRQFPAQAGDPHRLPRQDRPGLGHQPPAIGGHRHTAAACAILHLKSAFDSGTDRTLDKPNPPRSKALFSFV